MEYINNMGLIFRIIAGAIGGLWRRFFGGYDSKYDALEKRGVQMIFCIVTVFLWEFFIKHMPWYLALATAIFVYIFWCKGHFYYFQCGTESDEYIDQELAKGRKPAMNWIVAPVNKWLGFVPRSKQYCFVGMLLRYGLWSIPVAALIGWEFIICGLLVPFVYNACFWIELPPTKFAKSPTNFGELFSGFLISFFIF